MPTAPQRTLQVNGIGLDQACPNSTACGSVPRTIQFNTDGPSTISATMSNATAPVRVCLRMEPQLTGVCQTGRDSTVQKVTTSSGSDTWTVSLIGNNAAPTASVTIQFNANQPSATLDSFRYVGSSNPDYNGFDAQVNALAEGLVGLQASFDDGTNGAYDYTFSVTPDGGDAIVQSGGPSQTVVLSQAATQGGYRVAFSNPDPVSNPGVSVILTATISWP